MSRNQRRKPINLMRVACAAAPIPVAAPQTEPLELTPNQQAEQAELAEIIQYNECNGKLLVATAVAFTISLGCLVGGAIKENEQLVKLGSSALGIAGCLMTCLMIRSVAVARDFLGEWVPQHERNVRQAHAIIQNRRYRLATAHQKPGAAKQLATEVKAPAFNNN